MTAAERAVEQLAGLGYPDADVRAEGPQGEIAAVRVAPECWARAAGDDAARIDAALRALGFRYVALDLAPAGG